MIEKLEPLQGLDHSWLNKINELIDAVNALVKENNIHEEQIDELQMRTEMLEQRVKALDDPTSPTIIDPIEQPADTFAEQKRWIRKLCWFWNDGCSDYIGILYKIHDLDETPFENDLMEKYQHCRPVKPDDDIIYKGEQ